MKVFRIATLAGAAALAICGQASAGTATANLNSSATVPVNCTVSASALSLGSYDPISANAGSDLTTTTTVTTKCTKDASVTVTLDQGSNASADSTNDVPKRQLSAGNGNLLAYSLYQDAGYTSLWGNTTGSGVALTGSGTNQTSTVYAKVPAGQNVPAGNYSDTVVATVTF